MQVLAYVAKYEHDGCVATPGGGCVKAGPQQIVARLRRCDYP